MDHKKLAFQLDSPDKWFKILNKFLPSVINGSELTLLEEFGQGKLQYLKIQDGLWVQQMEFTLNEDLEFYRVAKATNDFFLIDFYLSEAKITRSSEGKTYTQSFENINVVLTSSTAISKTEIPRNRKVKIFNILFSREWLFQNVIGDHPGAANFFKSDAPIYLSENLDFKLKALLGQMDFEKNSKLVSIYSGIQIIDYLFDRFDRRKLALHKTKIHPDDLNQLLRVREFLDESPERDILIEDLCYAAGMSLSKFKRLFKQLFGTTPYKYHLRNKMEKAMEMLQMGQYSISETGFLMGYSNLSQFSKAFRNHFGILPSEVIV